MPSNEVSRAAAAYRAAERLGRSSRHSEWQRLCEADGTRKSTRAFADLFASDLDEVEDAEFIDLDDPLGHEHRIRSAYLLAAVFVGIVCLVLGSLIAF